jgi:hypothetical protein
MAVMRNRRVGYGAAVSLLLLLSLIGCSGARDRASARAADHHADVAGTVLIRGFEPQPSRWAAWTVAGHRGDTTIDAVSATGTTWNGSLVLRITVDLARNGFDRDRTTRCYRYDFRHIDTDDNVPHRLDHCPPTPVLVLTAPPPAPALDAADAHTLAQALNALPARTVPAVQRLLASRFGPPAVTSAAPGVGDITFAVNDGYGQRCLHGTLPPRGPARIIAAHGTDCRGG